MFDGCGARKRSPEFDANAGSRASDLCEARRSPIADRSRERFAFRAPLINVCLGAYRHRPVLVNAPV
jgi:hypothetical protein